VPDPFQWRAVTIYQLLLTGISVPSLFTRSAPRIPIRGLHLDLKGVPPTIARLLQLLKVIAAGRYNMLLVEWEDMFPWTVDERFRSPTAYTPDEVRQFAQTAAELNLEVVPLVQSLGHMETVLRIDDYAHMRELPDRSDVLNPLAEGASQLICRMVDDVTALLPNLRYFHIGGDEAWTFGSHRETKAYIEKHGKAALYLHHIQPILDHLENKQLRPILWHDMMIDWEVAALQKLARQADLMAWGYGDAPDTTKHHYNTKYIQRFSDAGVPLWGATAYKGADGPGADLPDLAKRRTNAIGWMQVNERIPFKGIVATAWSRYSTHRVQCEPIDGSLDALLLVGAILHDGDAPLEKRQACLDILKELNEAERFNAARDALALLSDIRSNAWGLIQMMREQVAMKHYDSIRSDAGVESIILEQINHWIAQWDQAAGSFRAALTDAIPQRWIEEYLAVRIDAIKAAVADLRAAAGINRPAPSH
jgi:hexosaminidase